MAENEPPKTSTYLSSALDLSPFPELEKPEIDPAILKRVQAHISWSEAQSGLGKMLIEFQFLETALREYIANLIDKNDSTVGYITTTRMRFIQLLNVLCALFAHRCKNEEKVNALREILKKCAECNERRNELVHSFWYSDEDEGIAVRFEIRIGRGKLPYDESEEWVPGDLLELDAKMCEIVRADLDRFFDEYKLSEQS